MDTNFVHITGSQAVKLLRAARAEDIVTATPCAFTRVQPFGSSLSSIDDLHLDGLLSWLNVGPKNPLHIRVPNARSRSSVTGVRSTVLSRDVPQGGFLEITNGKGKHALKLDSRTRVIVDSPSLALVGMSQLISQHVSNSKMGELEAKLRLIALASEFCASYALDPLKPNVNPAHFDKRNKNLSFINPDELRLFLDDMPKTDGLVLARKAATYAIDGSGSPMETFINHALTLPPRLAGLSMPEPLANKKLVLESNEKWNQLKHESLRPDFQWPSYRVLAEYLGDEEHASHDARVEDKNRIQDYAMGDYTPLYWMFDDVRSVAALNRTAMMLARLFARHKEKKYEPYRIMRLLKDEEFVERQITLVSKLLPPVRRYVENTPK